MTRASTQQIYATQHLGCSAAEMGASNADEAIDQVGDYDSLADAVRAYRQNAIDTALEYGVSAEEALSAFWATIREIGPHKENRVLTRFSQAERPLAGEPLNICEPTLHGWWAYVLADTWTDVDDPCPMVPPTGHLPRYRRVGK